MASISLPFSFTSTKTSICLVGISFVLFQFFLQLSSGVVIGSIIHEMQLSALAAGILSSAFYYVYTTLQIPVGMLFDLKNTRKLITGAALVCSVGCVFFAHSHTFFYLILGRLIIGLGASFAFIGLSHLLRQHFPLNRFAFIIGLSETLGFLVTMLGIIGLSLLINYLGWRNFINNAAVIGVIIAFISWQVIPGSGNQTCSNGVSIQIKQLLIILKSGTLWINGLFVGLGFTIITVFGAMWAVPFIQVKLGCDLQQASLIDAMIFCGAAISCPLFGYLDEHFKRRPLMIISSLTTALLFLIALFWPITSLLFMAILIFLIGVSCGAYMLAYSIANELAPQGALSTCTGFTNTLAMLTAPLMQPLIGYLLDVGRHTGQIYHIFDYQRALLILPSGLVVASVLVMWLPEKTRMA